MTDNPTTGDLTETTGTIGPGAGAPGSTQIEIPGALDKERVDRGVAMLISVSRAEAARLVAAGSVVVAGRPVTSGSQRLRAGQVIDIGPLFTSSRTAADDAFASAPGEARQSSGASGVGVGNATQRDMGAPRARVVYADDQVIVVDKPAGLVVHPGAGNPRGTLVDQLLADFPDLAGAGPDAERPGIVHRLDKGTSGLLVIARTPRAREDLVAQMASRSTHRRYLAVVHGEIAAEEGVIEAPVGRSPNFRTKMAVVQDGRFARTRYRTLCRSSAAVPLTLVECRLDTGRTHQVRVHMAAIGHPVLGDDRYSPPLLLKAGKQTAPGLRRPFLHAAELGFDHPETGERLLFESQLPEDLQGLVARLGLSDAN